MTDARYTIRAKYSVPVEPTEQGAIVAKLGDCRTFTGSVERALEAVEQMVRAGAVSVEVEIGDGFVDPRDARMAELEAEVLRLEAMVKEDCIACDQCRRFILVDQITHATQAELDAMTDPRLLSLRDMADKKRAEFLDRLYSKVEQGYIVNVTKEGKLVEQIKLSVPALLNGESVTFEMTPRIG